MLGPGVYGFQDMVAGIADPSLAHYKPRASQADLAEAFRTRWVNSLNAAAPYAFIKQEITKAARLTVDGIFDARVIPIKNL